MLYVNTSRIHTDLPDAIASASGCILSPHSKAELKATASPMPAFAAETTFPERIDPRGWLKVENQGNVGSCFPAGHKVTMDDGSLMNIEDVRFGHRVLTHMGRSRRVIDSMSRKYTGELHRVFVKGWGWLSMTHDHLVMVARDGGYKWTEAADLQIGDELVISNGVQGRSLPAVDMSYYCDSETQLDGDLVSVKGSPQFVDKNYYLDELGCWALGLFLAEGSTDKSAYGTPHRATWTLHQDEVEYADKLKSLADRYGVECQVQAKSKSKAINVRIGCSVLAQFLDKVIGKHCNLKKVPWFILSGTREQKLAFLRGYYHGDGSFASFHKGRESAAGNVVQANTVHSASASRVAAQQVATLAVSLGMKPGRSYTRKRDHQRFGSYQTYLYSADACEIAEAEYKPDRPMRRSLTNTAMGQHRKIREIQKVPVVDLMVYDITVEEDHSFVCQGLVVHNCQGHSLTTTMEGAYYLATAGSIQLCRNFAYVMSQKVDNISGDSGSTVSGGVKVATSAGLCREELWKYSGSYTRNPPGGWDPLLKDGLNYVAGGYTPIEGYDQAFKFHASRLGWIHSGFMWGDSVDRQAGNGGVIENWSPGGGGHSVAFVGYTPEKSDGQGRPYLIQVNSWSERWGNNGFVLWSPKAFDAMCNHQWSEVVGIHSLKLGKDAVVPNWI